MLAHREKPFTKATAKSFEPLTEHQSSLYPSKGGLLLFGKNREELFPAPLIRLVRFDGTNKNRVLDQMDLRSPLSTVLDEVLAFIRRNTSLGAVIKDIRRKDIPQYLPLVLREAVLNALSHADYSAMEPPIHISIFDDRLEITNPGPMPLGMSIEIALSGVSQLRNKVIGRAFRKLRLTDQWGSGLNRMIDACRQNQIKPPKFEELGQFFRVTLYPQSTSPVASLDWHTPILEHLQQNENITAKTAQELWKISRRAASTRLKEMCQQGILVEISTGPRDPYKVFISTEHRTKHRST